MPNNPGSSKTALPGLSADQLTQVMLWLHNLAAEQHAAYLKCRAAAEMDPTGSLKGMAVGFRQRTGGIRLAAARLAHVQRARMKQEREEERAAR